VTGVQTCALPIWLFREFAVTLSAAILVSLVVSLTTTPMMCAALLRTGDGRGHGRVYRASEAAFNWMRDRYDVSLRWSLRHPVLMLLLMALTVATNVLLYAVVPRGFFPEQDTGRIGGSIQADQDVSFQSMKLKLERVMAIIKRDPEVSYAAGFTGGGNTAANAARMFISLRPFDERQATSNAVIARLRGKLSGIPGAPVLLQPVQDLRIGGRMSNAMYQYTLRGDNLAELVAWAPRVL
jgi:multidrug efflux pump